MVILVVDDNPVSARLVERVLQSEGYGTAVAANGRAALEMLETTADVRLIVCDMRMPEMDGLEFLQELQARPLYKDVPVLMVTAATDPETVRSAMKLGVKSYIRKPASAMVLIEKVHALIDARPVLREKREVMRSLGFEPRMTEAYDDLALQFAGVVSNRLDQLTALLETDDPVARIDLFDLLESAQILGADRLLGVVERIVSGSADGPSLRTEYAFLVKELKLLHGVLPQPTEPEPAPSGAAASEAPVAE
jgi:two-component system chemotaxis response regulator CheY